MIPHSRTKKVWIEFRLSVVQELRVMLSKNRFCFAVW